MILEFEHLCEPKLLCTNNTCQLCSIDIRSTRQITSIATTFNRIEQCPVLVTYAVSNNINIRVAIDTDELCGSRSTVVVWHQISAIFPGPAGRTSHPGGNHNHAAAIGCTANGTWNVMVVLACIWWKIDDFVFGRVDISPPVLRTCLVHIIFRIFW